MSAHVVPKAPVVRTEDEDEKTTIESGWEEEASTTIEQGDVADKIRALALEAPRRSSTNITSTNGGSMPDEPTVDDPRGAAALAMLPPPVLARLVITQGNDSGQAIEVRPGKTYTIGRGIDNDLVLTDIAVSRKHFDVRHENGSWVLADRGSGNGTLINHRIEDAPFLLASGDVIEIGNTAFRFDQASGAPRLPSSYEVAVDDDLELPTVSVRQFREVEAATPHPHVAPFLTPAVAPAVAARVTQRRPKTFPPPAPLARPRPPSSRPPGGYALDRPGPAPMRSPMSGRQAFQQQQPATTLPLSQMANRPPLPPARLLGPPPTTIPGQGPPLPSGHPARLPFSYPSASEPSQRQAPNHPRGQVVVASGQPGRDATSTALVQPMSYATGLPMMVPQQTYSAPPQLSRRMKMVLGATGLALFAAVGTIAVIKGSSGNPTPTDHPPGALSSRPLTPPGPPRPLVEPIQAAGAPRTTTPNPLPAPATHKIEKIATTLTATIPTIPTTVTPTPPTTPAATKLAATATPTPPAPTPPVTPRTDKRLPKQGDKKGTPPKPEVALVDTARTDRTNKVEVAPNTPRTDKKHGGRSSHDVKNDADVMYRARRFSDAAALVTAALASFSGGDSQELKSIAAIYSQLGKAYNVGMAPGTKPTDAFVALRRAISYDRDVGAAYVAELERVLVTVASKAALSFAAAREYESAFQAVRISESLGSTSPTNKSVRDKLEELAAELYRAASSELTTDPDGAKQKLRQILGIVDVKAPLYVKATKLLNGS